jgi:hypothetical protein
MAKIQMTFLGVRRTARLVPRAVTSCLAASRALAGVAGETGGTGLVGATRSTPVISVARTAERPQ